MTSSIPAVAFPPMLFRHAARSTIRACVTAGMACIACADACVLDGEPDPLRRCIHLTLSCADQCARTIELLAQPLGPNIAQLRSHLTRLLRVLATCEAECREQLGHHGCGSVAVAVANCGKRVKSLLDSLGPQQLSTLSLAASTYSAEPVVEIPRILPSPRAQEPRGVYFSRAMARRRA